MKNQIFSRRGFLSAGTVALGAAALGATSRTGVAAENAKAASSVVVPPEGKRILLSCKLGMIAKERDGKKLSVVERLKMAADAGAITVDNSREDV